MSFRAPLLNYMSCFDQKNAPQSRKNTALGMKIAGLLLIGISLSACTAGSRSFFGDEMITGSVNTAAMPTNLAQAMPAPANQRLSDSLYNVASNDAPFSPALPINGGRKIQVVAQAKPQLMRQPLPQVVQQPRQFDNQGFIGEDQFVTASVARSAPAQLIQQKMPVSASALPKLISQQPVKVAAMPTMPQQQTLPTMRNVPIITTSSGANSGTSFSESNMSAAQAQRIHVSPVMRPDTTIKAMPTMPTIASASSNGFAHTITAGESLYAIAIRYNVSSDLIVAANKLGSPDRIYVGQQLIIPGQIKAPVNSTITVAANNNPPVQKMPAMPKIDYTITGSVPKTNPVAVAPASSGSVQKFRWPVTGRVISDFAASNNTGISIDVPEGATVRSAENGSVLYVGQDIEWYGNLVLVKHDNGLVSAYAHLKDITVQKGDIIRRGGALGTVGMSGAAKRPQLHFELRKGAKPVNPIDYLSS